MSGENPFGGFHVRQTPMTPEDELRARRADEIRAEFDELLAGEGTSFLDRSPIIGASNPLAVPMVVEVAGEGETAVVVGRVTFPQAYEGPPGCVHGGFIAAYFDEVLGVAQSASGNPGMTANLTIDYRSPTPLNEAVVFRAWFERRERRKIYTRGTLHHGERLCAEASGLFVSLSHEVFERLIEMRKEG